MKSHLSVQLRQFFFSFFCPHFAVKSLNRLIGRPRYLALMILVTCMSGLFFVVSASCLTGEVLIADQCVSTGSLYGDGTTVGGECEFGFARDSDDNGTDECFDEVRSCSQSLGIQVGEPSTLCLWEWSLTYDEVLRDAFEDFCLSNDCAWIDLEREQLKTGIIPTCTEGDIVSIWVDYQSHWYSPDSVPELPYPQYQCVPKTCQPYEFVSSEIIPWYALASIPGWYWRINDDQTQCHEWYTCQPSARCDEGDTTGCGWDKPWPTWNGTCFRLCAEAPPRNATWSYTGAAGAQGTPNVWDIQSAGTTIGSRPSTTLGVYNATFDVFFPYTLSTDTRQDTGASNICHFDCGTGTYNATLNECITCTAGEFRDPVTMSCRPDSESLSTAWAQCAAYAPAYVWWATTNITLTGEIVNPDIVRLDLQFQSADAWFTLADDVLSETISAGQTWWSFTIALPVGSASVSIDAYASGNTFVSTTTWSLTVGDVSTYDFIDQARRDERETLSAWDRNTYSHVREKFFGCESPYMTQWTQTCDQVGMNVELLSNATAWNTLPSTLSGNTIYLWNGWSYAIAPKTLSSCTALTGRPTSSDARLHLQNSQSLPFLNQSGAWVIIDRLQISQQIDQTMFAGTSDDLTINNIYRRTESTAASTGSRTIFATSGTQTTGSTMIINSQWDNTATEISSSPSNQSQIRHNNIWMHRAIRPLWWPVIESNSTLWPDNRGDRPATTPNDEPNPISLAGAAYALYGGNTALTDSQTADTSRDPTADICFARWHDIPTQTQPQQRLADGSTVNATIPRSAQTRGDRDTLACPDYSIIWCPTVNVTNADIDARVTRSIAIGDVNFPYSFFEYDPVGRWFVYPTALGGNPTASHKEISPDNGITRSTTPVTLRDHDYMRLRLRSSTEWNTTTCLSYSLGRSESNSCTRCVTTKSKPVCPLTSTVTQRNRITMDGSTLNGTMYENSSVDYTIATWSTILTSGTLTTLTGETSWSIDLMTTALATAALGDYDLTLSYQSNPVQCETPGSPTTETLTISEPSLGLSKSFDQSSYVHGDTVVTTITLSNTGNGGSWPLTITDALPDTQLYQNSSWTTGSIVSNGYDTATMSGETTLYTRDITNLAPSETMTLTMTGQLVMTWADATGTGTDAVTNCAYRGSETPVCATADYVSTSDWAVETVMVDTPLIRNEEFPISMTVTNNGPDTATGAMELSRDETIMVIWSNLPTTGGNNILTVTDVMLGSGASQTWMLTWRIDDNTTTSIQRQAATLPALVVDPHTANNISMRWSSVIWPQLLLTKTANVTGASFGDVIRYELTVTNTWDAASSATTVTDVTGTGLLYLTGTRPLLSSWATATGQTRERSVPSLSPGQSLSWTYDLQVERSFLYDQANVLSGRAYSFDGSNDYVQVPHDANIMNWVDFTFAVSFVINSIPNDSTVPAIFNKYSVPNWMHLIVPWYTHPFGGQISIWGRAGNSTTNWYFRAQTSYQIQTWQVYHVIGRKIWWTIELRVNWVLEDTVTSSLFWWSLGNTENLFVWSLTNSSNRLDWYIWWLSMWNRALTNAELNDVWSWEYVSMDQFRKMDEWAWTIAYDSSGNGNHGTLVNGVSHITTDDFVCENGYSRSILNKATIQWIDACAFVPYLPTSLFSLTKTASLTGATIGDIVTYTIDVTNTWPDPSAITTLTDSTNTGVQLTGTIPTSYVSTALTATGQELSFEIPWLSVGGNTSITYDMAVVTSMIEQRGMTWRTNTAWIGDVMSDAFVSYLPSYDLSVTKDADLSVARSWDDIEYTITVTNTGPDTAQNISLTDILDPDLTLSVGQTAWTIPSLIPGATWSTTLTATVWWWAWLFVTNDAFVTDARDTDTSNNTWSVTVSIDNTPPTATIVYAPPQASWWTMGPVIATLTGESEPITITNNAWSRDYSFALDGSFVYTFQDAVGNTWSATAEVTWIDLVPPAPDVTYNHHAPVPRQTQVTLTTTNVGHADWSDDLFEVVSWSGDVSQILDVATSGYTIAKTITFSGDRVGSVTIRDQAGNQTIVPIEIIHGDHAYGHAVRILPWFRDDRGFDHDGRLAITARTDSGRVYDHQRSVISLDVNGDATFVTRPLPVGMEFATSFQTDRHLVASYTGQATQGMSRDYTTWAVVVGSLMYSGTRYVRPWDLSSRWLTQNNMITALDYATLNSLLVDDGSLDYHLTDLDKSSFVTAADQAIIIDGAGETGWTQQTWVVVVLGDQETREAVDFGTVDVTVANLTQWRSITGTDSVFLSTGTTLSGDQMRVTIDLSSVPLRRINGDILINDAVVSPIRIPVAGDNNETIKFELTYITDWVSDVVRLPLRLPEMYYRYQFRQSVPVDDGSIFYRYVFGDGSGVSAIWSVGGWASAIVDLEGNVWDMTKVSGNDITINTDHVTVQGTRYTAPTQEEILLQGNSFFGVFEFHQDAWRPGFRSLVVLRRGSSKYDYNATRIGMGNYSGWPGAGYFGLTFGGGWYPLSIKTTDRLNTRHYAIMTQPLVGNPYGKVRANGTWYTGNADDSRYPRRIQRDLWLGSMAIANENWWDGKVFMFGAIDIVMTADEYDQMIAYLQGYF